MWFQYEKAPESFFLSAARELLEKFFAYGVDYKRLIVKRKSTILSTTLILRLFQGRLFTVACPFFKRGKYEPLVFLAKLFGDGVKHGFCLVFFLIGVFCYVIAVTA